MNTDHIIDDLMEELAAIEHNRWAKWQRYLHGKAEQLPDGSLTIPVELVRRWERQFQTPYALLSDRDKENDREQVREYVDLIKNALRR